MPAYNGSIASLIKGSGGGNAVLTGVSRTNCLASVPQKCFENVFFGAVTTGISGSVYVSIVCSIGGATAVFAGGNISANGSLIIGSTGTAIVSVPRPVFVGFSSTTAASGFTTTVTMSGMY